MSKMGRAYQWVQEKGLQGHPDALKIYITHLNKQKEKPKNDSETKIKIEESK